MLVIKEIRLFDTEYYDEKTAYSYILKFYVSEVTLHVN